MTLDTGGVAEPIRVLATGGTIDKVYYDARDDYAIGDPQVIPLFAEANVTVPYVVESVLRKDSLELTAEDRALIVRRASEAPETRILVTHGTDTMTETAAALEAVTGKAIVLTGAMQPARMRSSDAFFNLGCAVAAVQLVPPGVWIAMNGRVFPSGSVRKNREARRFEPATDTP